MKRFKNIITGLICLTLVSCQKDFFNQVPDDQLNIDQVFQRQDLSDQYLANVYNYIKDDSWLAANVSPWCGLSDEVDITYDRAGFNTYPINIGNWSPSSTYFDTDLYYSYYKGIRSASYFMQNIGKNGELLSTSAGLDIIKRWTAEARAVRAYLYFNLLRAYGPFIILPETPIAPDVDPSDELSHLSRNSYDECVNYVVAELDKAKADLPVHFTVQSSTEYGRMTQLACMALKSRLLLYAASPQFNGNSDYTNFKNKDGKQLMNATYDATKWAKAAAAAKDIIDLNLLSLFKKNDASNVYDPMASYRDEFLTAWNSEWIFARNTNLLATHERHCSPRQASGYASSGITQQQIDAFFMANGKQPITGYNADGSAIINAGSGYTETGFSTVADKYTRVGTYNGWMNREPRFYVCVNYNGAAWINPSEGVKIIATTFNGESGKSGSFDYSRTGYFVRKNIDPGSNPRTNIYVKRPYVMMRYAEILLNYAEALNESSPGSADIVKYLNLIRERAGVAQYGAGAGALPVPASQEDMRQAIRAERRVELCFEHHRYFDTRRWKIAEQTDGGGFYGMNVDANAPGFYARTKFETRVFLKSYYLFPIPQPEIDKNPNMVQNPNW
jgi:hypothetical protein